MLFGSCGKTHLFFWLQAMADGRLWDHDQSIMKPPQGDKAKELLEHLKHGMYYRVISWEAVRDHPEKVKDLMRQDNVSVGFDMGQHLIGLIEEMHKDTLAAPSPAPGSTLYDGVRAMTSSKAQARWSEKDMVSCFNLAMTLDHERLQVRTDFHLYWVSPTVTAVKPEFLAAVATLDM